MLIVWLCLCCTVLHCLALCCTVLYCVVCCVVLSGQMGHLDEEQFLTNPKSLIFDWT
jgi:hypothetical protein